MVLTPCSSRRPYLPELLVVFGPPALDMRLDPVDGAEQQRVVVAVIHLNNGLHRGQHAALSGDSQVADPRCRSPGGLAQLTVGAPVSPVSRRDQLGSLFGDGLA